MTALGRRWRTLIAAGAVLSFLATVASLLVGGRLAGPRPTGMDSYSKGPLGHEVAYKLLNELDYQVTRQHTAYHQTDVALFIEPSFMTKSTSHGDVFLTDVLEERSALKLASIVVLPKWRVNADGEVTEASEALLDLQSVVAPGVDLVWRNAGEMTTEPVRYEEEGSLGSFTVELPWRQSIVTPEGFEALLGAEDEALVVVSQDTTRFIVSDPDIFHNFNIQRADHARLVEAILSAAIHGDAAAVDEVFHGHAQLPSLGHSLSRFPAFLVVAQGVALCLMVFLFGFRRFGAPRIERVRWERGPLEAVEVSAEVLAIGQPPTTIAAEYVRRAIQECAERLGLTAKNLRDRAARIDKLLVRRGLDPTAVLTLNQAARLENSNQSLVVSLHVARKAHRLHAQLRDEDPSAKRGNDS